MTTPRSAVRLSARIRHAGLILARASRGWVLSAAVSALLIAPAHADSSPLAEPPTELPVLDITADPLGREDPAFRPLVVMREDHAGHAFATFKDSLRAVPGLILQDSFGGFEPPRLSLRGSGLQSAPSSRGVQLLLDGFPLSLADGSFNTALIDPQLFERIEVVRGAAAASLAPAALGGAILFRPPSPPRGAGLLPADSLHAETGSFGGARLRFNRATVLADTAIQAAASFAHLDGFRDYSAQSRTAFFGNARHTISENCNTSVSLYRAHARYEVPGPLTLAAASVAPHSVSSEVRRDRPRRESSVTQLAAQTAQQSSVLRLETGLSWLRSDDWFRQLRPLGISDSQSDDLTLRSVLIRRFDGRDGEHQVRAGATLSRGWRDVERFVNDSGTTGRQFADARLFSTTASLDVEATAQLRGNLALIAGATALSARRDTSIRASAILSSTPPLRVRAATLQPRARLIWRPRQPVLVFAAVSRSAEPPTFDDLLAVTGSHPDLRLTIQALATQRATTWEVGSAGTHGRIGWDVTGYHAEWTSEILRLADAQGIPRGAVNAGPTRHIGLEAAGRCRVLVGPHELDLVAVATWSRFSFADDPVYRRNRLAGAPLFVGSVELDYRHHRGFFAASTLELTAGATPVDHANRLTYGGHALTHLRFGWQSPLSATAREHGRWTYFIEVRNLFDRAYIASTAGVLDLARSPAATALFLPGAPRTFVLGIDWRH